MSSENTPELWQALLPRPAADGHKYHRGHTVIFGSDKYTGATRLAAEACSRIGSGLVTVMTSNSADIYRTTLPADIMVSTGALNDVNRPSALLAGPGGCCDAQAEQMLNAPAELAIVLDADAIRLAGDLYISPSVLTPHAAEFDRYFGEISGAPDARLISAAKQTNSVVVLKGAETKIVAPDGRTAINRTASPYLAKAGTGDVLAGLIAGLIAQGMPLFEAACAGVYIHGLAGQRIGPGLIPQDIIAETPNIISDWLA